MKWWISYQSTYKGWRLELKPRKVIRELRAMKLYWWKRSI